MNISKQQLISVGLGLVSLLNRNFDDAFLENQPEKIDISYELPSYGFTWEYASIHENPELLEEIKNEQN